MPAIDEQSILAKVNAWTHSAEGKKVINSKYFQGAKAPIADKEIRRIISDLLREIEVSFGAAYIKSRDEVKGDRRYPFAGIFMTSRIESSVAQDGQSYEYRISFGRSDDDLTRNSLLITSGEKNEQRTGEGIENIIALFERGYVIGKTVPFGKWESKSRGFKQDTIALGRRAGLNAIAECIERFNRTYEGMGLHASFEDELYSRPLIK